MVLYAKHTLHHSFLAKEPETKSNQNYIRKKIRKDRIKQAVVGTGAAEKTQVQQMVKLLLALPAAPKADAADALAAAICHAHSKSLVQAAQGKSFSRRRLR